jgi:transposase
MSEQAKRRESLGQHAGVATPQPPPPEKDSAQASAPDAGSTPHPLGQPRLRTIDRQQILPPMTLDQVIEPDHPARSVWRFVQGLDLTPLYQRIASREHSAGRPASDPRVLVALWLYAILYRVVSARRLADLCTYHNAFLWLRGGVPVNHHMLSDFLVEHLDFLKQLFIHSVKVLREEGLVDLHRVGQDGIRVRASAGAASFHCQATLQRQLEEAQAEWTRLQEELQLAPGPTAASGPTQTPEIVVKQEDVSEPSAARQDKPKLSKQQAAAVRAAREQLQRAEQALQRLPEMEAKKKADDKDKARVSSTDPQATVMKMPDGGYRPAYNIQYSTDCGHQVIVGVEVVTIGSDQGQLQPMLTQVEKDLGKKPEEALVDGGFVKLEEIEEIQKEEEGKTATKVYMPVPEPKDKKRQRYAAMPGDSETVAEWRERMGTEEAKEIYKERAATAELVNAQARNRGLVRLLVRGVKKVKAVALWFATVHNMARAFALLPQPTPLQGEAPGLSVTFAI